MWQGASLWIVDARLASERKTQNTDFHAHHAIQLTAGLGGRFAVTTGAGETQGDLVAVAADVPHRFEAEGLVAILFVEPESQPGRAILQGRLNGHPARALAECAITDLAARIAADYRSGGGNLAALGSALVARIAGETKVHAPDLRVRKVIAWASQKLDQPLSLSDAAAFCGVSPSRLRHLFVEQTGLPFRTYLLWLRLSRGVTLLAAGAGLTEAAHEAGFADSAHFSRTFRRMFGVAPSNLAIS